MTFWLALLLSGLSGLVALSSELIWFRSWSFAVMGVASSFGSLLGFYLLGIAGGSFASARLCRDRTAEALRPVVWAIALCVLAASVLGFLVTPAIGLAARLGREPAALPFVALTTTLMGAVFPLISHAGVSPDDRAGSRVSYLYVANIVGSATGSLLTGFVLMDLWSLRTIATVVALAGLVLAAGVMLLARPSRPELARGGAGIVAVGVAILALGPALYRDVYEKMQLGKSYDPAHPFAHIVETRSGVITVGDDGRIYGGGAYDGVFQVDLHDDRNGIYRALAMGATRPAAREVLMIGLSSGSWARVIAAFPSVQRLTIIEINPGYLELIRLYPGGAELLANPKVRVVIDDGRRWMQRHPEARFDLIVQNTTWHWRGHITNLLSREYLELTHAHLTPGGLFFYNTTFSPHAQKAAVTLFPYAWRVGSFVAASDAPIAFDKERWRAFLSSFRLEGRPLLDLTTARDRQQLEKVLAIADKVDEEGDERQVNVGIETRDHMVARLATAEVVTDDNMRVEWRR
jgi:spermidine synthase